MPLKLSHNHDGANFIAQAILALVSDKIGDGIEESYQTGVGYEAEPSVTRWENVRAQGYMIVLTHHRTRRQINICFSNNPSSDDIAFLVFKSEPTLKAYTPENLPEEWWDDFRYRPRGAVVEVANTVVDLLTAFWGAAEAIAPYQQKTSFSYDAVAAAAKKLRFYGELYSWFQPRDGTRRDPIGDSEFNGLVESVLRAAREAE